MAKSGGGSSRPAPKATAPKLSNAALTKQVRAADADVQKAQAQANLVRAQIEVTGKQVTHDWKDGIPIVKVVNAKR